MKFTQSAPSCSQHKQGTEGWLEDRQKTLLTGSVVPDVCGFGYKSRTERWRLSTGKKKEETNDYLQALYDYGHEQEPHAKATLEMELGLEEDTIQETSLWFNPAYPHLSATPDGLFHVDEELLVVELKCPQNTQTVIVGEKKWICYIIQLAVEIMCTGASGGVLFVYHPEQECLMTYWPRDRELEKLILSYVDDFRAYVESDKEPPMMSGSVKRPITSYFERKLLDNRSLFT